MSLCSGSLYDVTHMGLSEDLLKVSKNTNPLVHNRMPEVLYDPEQVSPSEVLVETTLSAQQTQHK